MANGRPGDNPVTDLVVHNYPLFDPETDQLVKEVYPYNQAAIFDLVDKKFRGEIELAQLKAMLLELK